jgi:hypothetical protein
MVLPLAGETPEELAQSLRDLDARQGSAEAEVVFCRAVRKSCWSQALAGGSREIVLTDDPIGRLAEYDCPARRPPSRSHRPQVEMCARLHADSLFSTAVRKGRTVSRGQSDRRHCLGFCRP